MHSNPRFSYSEKYTFPDKRKNGGIQLMHVKKWIAFALAAVMIAGILAGCNEKPDGGSSSSSSSSSSSQSTGGGHNNSGSSGQQDTSKTYTVTAIIGEGGTVTYNKKQVESGASFKGIPADSKVTFTVAPDDGYEIADVIVTGGTVTDDGKGNYTLTVTGNCTVSVTFAGILRDVEFESINGQSFDKAIRKVLTKKNDVDIQSLITTAKGNEDKEFFGAFKIINRYLRVAMLTEGANARPEVIRENIAKQLVDYMDITGDDMPLSTGTAGLHNLNSNNYTRAVYLEVFDTTNSEAVKNAIAAQLSDLPKQFNDPNSNRYFEYVVTITGVTLGNKGYTAVLVSKTTYSVNTDVPVPPIN